MEGKKQTSIRFSFEDQKRLERLRSKTGLNQTVILSIAIKKLYDENFPQSNGGILIPFCDEQLLDNLPEFVKELQKKELDVQVICGGVTFLNPHNDEIEKMREIVRKHGGETNW